MLIRKKTKLALFVLAIVLVTVGGFLFYTSHNVQDTKVKDVVCVNIGKIGQDPPIHIEKKRIKEFCDLMEENIVEENQYDAEMVFGQAQFEIYYQDGSEDSISMNNNTIWTSNGQYHSSDALFYQVLSMFGLGD